LLLANQYYFGALGIQKDHTKAIEHITRAEDLGWGEAHCNLGYIYRKAGYLKKAKFHYEEGAMAGQKVAIYNLGGSEAQSGNLEQGTKQWTIAASAGDYHVSLATWCGKRYGLMGLVSRESFDSTLEAYKNSCAEIRSKDRAASYIRSRITQSVIMTII
jgi:TPR repeat protein